ncbi:disulfide bond formation protein B [Cognatishimia sp. F0-27]|uniref:disulfide bond formation protein B n=1 Tax=Cognatishimia sp. F0-27 TaxID=2816855 RepID=UPI001D0C48E0|nr:disulfide bond formation protein B [Cognatishimia sp. F0-27]MCC1493350.1 disulfide bond formation protein B [Cognatishimia sp. F0-27]
MTRRALILLASAGSAALILAALGFQYLGEMPPCKLCYWQRYGHFVAIAAAIGVAIPMTGLVLVGFAGALSSAVIGGYHTGVERGWWEGPTSCSSQSIDGLSAAELLEQIMNAPLVRCDEVPWAMAGLSMASWNAIASAGLALIWLLALRARS